MNKIIEQMEALRNNKEGEDILDKMLIYRHNEAIDKCIAIVKNANCISLPCEVGELNKMEIGIYNTAGGGESGKLAVKENRKYLKDYKEWLSAKELDILFDRYCEFKTYEELAIEYEMTPQKVKTIISVILRKFRSPKYMNKIRAVSREVCIKELKEGEE